MTARKVVSLFEVQQVAASCHHFGLQIVTTNGCFDLLHVGHIRCLQAAREQGDMLIVGLNSDASVRALKGPSRPAQPQEDRAEILAALGCVDLVVIFDETLPLAFLSAVRPNVHVKGGDYVAEDMPEYGVVTGWGGRVVIVPMTEGRSTTGIIHANAEAR